MLSNEQYIRLSLDLNLFFLRIIKEHAIFIGASLPPKYASLSMHFASVNRKYEILLARTINLANGNMSKELITSGELVTEFTLTAEKATEFLTGMPINTSITEAEMNLGYRKFCEEKPRIIDSVSMLNRQIIKELSRDINFQKYLLNEVLSCRIFAYTYPLNVEHVTEEAQVYMSMLNKIENKQGKDTTVNELIEQEIFWNHIMEEHSKFIRGYLDPSENNLFKIANSFAEKFHELYEATKKLVQEPNNIDEVTKESYNLVTELRDFKKEGTEGLLSCNIKAIMSALLADHVTREANHYLRLLRAVKMS